MLVYQRVNPFESLVVALLPEPGSKNHLFQALGLLPVKICPVDSLVISVLANRILFEPPLLLVHAARLYSSHFNSPNHWTCFPTFPQGLLTSIDHLSIKGFSKPWCFHLCPILFWLVVSTSLKNMKVSWDDDIPNIWKK